MSNFDEYMKLAEIY